MRHRTGELQQLGTRNTQSQAPWSTGHVQTPRLSQRSQFEAFGREWVDAGWIRERTPTSAVDPFTMGLDEISHTRARSPRRHDDFHRAGGVDANGEPACARTLAHDPIAVGRRGVEEAQLWSLGVERHGTRILHSTGHNRRLWRRLDVVSHSLTPLTDTRAMSQNSVTHDLAEQTRQFTLRDAPEAFRRSAVDLLTDHLGLVYFGSLVTGDGLVRYAQRFAQAGSRSVQQPGAWAFASRCVVPADVAAGVNAQLAQASGLENTGPGLHPGPLLVHVALAVGQSVRASGKQTLAALTWGYEVCTRFHFASREQVSVRQYPIIAALIAAKLLGLSTERTRAAISIAAEQPTRGGNFLRPKIARRVSRVPMGFLQSAFGGVQAALMAQDGFESLPDELDQWSAEYDLDALVRPPSPRHLGAHLALKRFPASHGCQMVLQMVEEWRERKAFDPRSIDSIEVTLPGVYLVPHQNECAPETAMQSIYGAPWALALVAHGVPPGPAWLDPAVLSDPRHRDLAAKVIIREDANATRAMSALDLDAVRGTVTMTSGSAVLRGEKLIRDTWGNSGAPLTPAMISDKFSTVTAAHLKPAAQRKLFETMRGFERLADIRAAFDSALDSDTDSEIR